MEIRMNNLIWLLTWMKENLRTLQFAVNYKAVKLNNINFWIKLLFVIYKLNKICIMILLSSNPLILIKFLLVCNILQKWAIKGCLFLPSYSPAAVSYTLMYRSVLWDDTWVFIENNSNVLDAFIYLNVTYIFLAIQIKINVIAYKFHLRSKSVV